MRAHTGDAGLGGGGGGTGGGRKATDCEEKELRGGRGGGSRRALKYNSPSGVTSRRDATPRGAADSDPAALVYSFKKHRNVSEP